MSVYTVFLHLNESFDTMLLLCTYMLIVKKYLHFNAIYNYTVINLPISTQPVLNIHKNDWHCCL